MKNLLFGGILLLFFLACSDDNDNIDTKTKQITKDEWQLVGWTVKYYSSGIEYTIDIFNYPEDNNVPECIIDDELIFQDNKTYQSTPGTVLCGNDNNYSLFGNGEWQFYGDTTLSMEPYGNFPAEHFKLVSLSDIELKISKLTTLTITKSGELIRDNNNAEGSTQAIEEYTYYH